MFAWIYLILRFAIGIVAPFEYLPAFSEKFQGLVSPLFDLWILTHFQPFQLISSVILSLSLATHFR